MYKVNIVCVGKLKEKFFIDAQNEYTKRLKRFCDLNIIEITENALEDNASEKLIEKSLDQECLKIIPHLKGCVLVLDSLGASFNSKQFSLNLIKNLNENGLITFVIGGSYGLSEKLKNKYNRISFSKLTFPHHLMRIFLLEQVYRGFCINSNITYHK